VVKIIKILEHEIAHGMRMLGAATVNDLVPEMVGYPCPTPTIHD
jgi:isopentenyl diphosphate isomerase/L-lactate dehydrogenase-like FMN-dependent dehydrogenase